MALFSTACALFRSGPFAELLSRGVPVLNRIRTELGLGPVPSVADLHDECSACIVASIAEFEPVPAGPNVRFVGPIAGGPLLLASEDEIDVCRRHEDLVIVSLSTSAQRQHVALQRIVDGLGGLHVDVVVTTGPSVDPATLRAASNTQIVRFVRHERLLADASLVVTHAGLGTVMNALRHGIPLVCMPMGRDQHFNAAQVERLQAGRSISDNASPDAIAETTRALLVDRRARANARHLAGVLAGYGGATDAIAELDRF